METGGVLPTPGSAQDFLPIDAPCTIHIQYDLDTDMEDETGPVQSKTNKKRVLMKLKGSSSSTRRDTVQYEANSGKDLARALAKLSLGGMSEFVQSVPANVAGFLMREGQQPLRHVGSASRSLSGNQAKKVFNGSPSEYFGHQSAKPGLFSAGEPASAFEGPTGVVAGTVLRRWNGNGGGRRWGPGVWSSSVAVSLKEVPGVHPAETDSGGFLLESSVAAGMETDSRGAQFLFPVVETEHDGAQIEYPAAETGAGGVQCDAGPSRYDPKCGQREGAEVLPIFGNAPRIRSSGGADVLAGRAAGHPCSSVDAGTGRHDVLGTAVVRAAGCAAGLERRAKRSQVRLERNEAGSLDSFGNDAFLSCRIESPSSRVARVTSALHNLCSDHSCLIPAHNSHARMPHAR